jgi:hypothetical protein
MFEEAVIRIIKMPKLDQSLSHLQALVAADVCDASNFPDRLRQLVEALRVVGCGPCHWQQAQSVDSLGQLCADIENSSCIESSTSLHEMMSGFPNGRALLTSLSQIMTHARLTNDLGSVSSVVAYSIVSEWHKLDDIVPALEDPASSLQACSPEVFDKVATLCCASMVRVGQEVYGHAIRGFAVAVRPLCVDRTALGVVGRPDQEFAAGSVI